MIKKYSYPTINFYKKIFKKKSLKIYKGGLKKKSSKNNPLVTIYTCIKNGSKTFQKTIDSVSSQTYKNIEYIIVDGGSTDNTLKIIKKNRRKISLWISEVDKGTSEANNKAISLASGKYLFWLSCDDIINKEFIEVAVKNFKKKNLDFVVGSMRMFASNNELNYLKKNKNNFDENFNISKFKQILFKGTGGIPYPAIIFNANLFKKFGLFSLNFQFINDFDFFIRIFKLTKPSYVYSNELIVFRKNGGLVDKNAFAALIEQFRCMKFHKLQRINFIFFYFPLLLKIILGRLKKFLF